MLVVCTMKRGNQASLQGLWDCVLANPSRFSLWGGLLQHARIVLSSQYAVVSSIIQQHPAVSSSIHQQLSHGS